MDISPDSARAVRATLEDGPVSPWRWILFSGLLHAALVISLFLIPYAPARRALNYPVYTVELVGGERIGEEKLSSLIPENLAIKKEEKARPEPAEVKLKEVKTVKEVKESKREKHQADASMPESVTKETRIEEKKAASEQGISDEVREKLIQAALERVREKAEQEQKQKKQKAESPSAGRAEGEGAAALGSGGRGGGILKGVDFLIYRNRMLRIIRERWTWVGKRSDLEVTVRFGIQENGEIVRLRIIELSGDASFDDSVLRAVRRSSPLPPPPENYRQDFMDVELTFRPKDLQG